MPITRLFTLWLMIMSTYLMSFQKKRTKGESDYLLVHEFMVSPLGIWAIEDKLTHQLIGCIRLEQYNAKVASAEVGYFYIMLTGGKVS